MVNRQRLHDRSAHRRADHVRGVDADGNVGEWEADEVEARMFQHELDHLNGVLFIDHISKLKRDMVVKEFTKAAARKTTA